MLKSIYLLKGKSNNSSTIKPRILRAKISLCIIIKLPMAEESLVVGILGFVELAFTFSFNKQRPSYTEKR